MKIEIELTGFTPVLDNLIQEYNLVTAAIYGIVWRYAQMKDKVCNAPLKKIGDRLDLSEKTAERHVKILCADGYLVDLTPTIRNKPHNYAVTGKAELGGVISARSVRESEQGPSESRGRSVRESEQGPSESRLKKQTKKQTKKQKDSSANADHSLPISLLSLEEIKNLELTITVWNEYLADEQAEKQRKGVIKFIESKIAYWNLLPRNDAENILFRILEVEYEDDGGKSSPKKFPSRETKRLFNEAAEFHNGTLENVIKKAIHKRGKSIRNITDYINSPKWQENSNGPGRKTTTNNGQATTENSQPTTSNFAGSRQAQQYHDPLIGSGQTPEMRKRLEAAFSNR